MRKIAAQRKKEVERERVEAREAAREKGEDGKRN